jgi:hypothetical protein
VYFHPVERKKWDEIHLNRLKQQIGDKEKELISMRKNYHELNQKYRNHKESYRIEFQRNQRINIQLDKKLQKINDQAA